MDQDWNAYRDYTPEKVMAIFDKVFIKNEDNYYLPLIDKYTFIPQFDQHKNDLYYNKQILPKLFIILVMLIPSLKAMYMLRCYIYYDFLFYI